MTQEPEARLWDMARAFQPSRILLSALELGVFAALGDKPRSPDAVAATIKADPRATKRLMNALVAIGLLVRHDELYGNSPDAEMLLVPGKPGYMGDALLHAANMWDTWSTLTGAVRAGSSVFHGGARSQADRAEAFIAAMHYNASANARQIVPLIDLAGVSRVLDVGGGSGAYSIAFCKAKSDLRAVVFDLPEIVPLTQRYIAEAGLSDRIKTHSGDYLKNDLGTDFDMVLLSQILHSNSAAQNTELLGKCSKALKPGGRIVIQDFIIEPSRTHPAQAAVFSLNMLVATEAGDTYTEEEIGGWLESAGFADIRRTDLPSGAAALLTVRKPGWLPGE